MLWIAVALPACDLVRASDPLTLDPDVVSVQAVAIGGDHSISAWVGFPHRDAAPAPPISLELVLDGRGIPFVAQDTMACPRRPWRSFGVFACVRVDLPRSLATGDTVRLRGSGPRGDIRGVAIIPPAPSLLQPGDTTLSGTDRFMLGTLEVRVAASAATPELRMRASDLQLTLPDGRVRSDCTVPGYGESFSDENPAPLRLWWIACPDVVPEWREARVHLAAIAYDSVFASLLRTADGRTLREPVPALGLEGAVGMFSAAAASRAVTVVVTRVPAAQPASAIR